MTNVLVVDDDRFMRSSLEDTLKGEGFKATIFECAPDALEAMAKFRFDVIITDLKMPGMTGLEFLREAMERDASLPVIVISVY